MEMASPKPCSAPARCLRWEPAAAPDGRELPFDLMLDVLLRVPGKDLCRLRAVCRSWRAVTADPLFITEHAARHPDPLFLVNLQGDESHIHVMDLSGAVVKRIAVPGAHRLLCTRLGLACATTEWNSCRVLDPATGAVLPGPPIPWHERIKNSTQRGTSFAFGQIAGIGEYKVLRMLHWCGHVEDQRFEVFTVNGVADNARWRRMQTPALKVEMRSAVAVDGVVYFLKSSIYNRMNPRRVNADIDPDCIASFDLGSEEWRRDLQGPISSSLVLDDEEDMFEYISMWRRLTLAELKGTIALAYNIRCQSDLWFLTDFESGVWVKEYSIQSESIIPCLAVNQCIKPLVVLGDGRLVIHLAPTGPLLIYDPRTETSDKVGRMGRIDAVALYSGSVLSLPYADVV